MGSHLVEIPAGPRQAPGGPLALCFATADGRRHPLPGLYHRDALRDLDRLPPDASLQALLDAVSHRVLTTEDVGNGVDLTAALRNVNRVEDLAKPSKTTE